MKIAILTLFPEMFSGPFDYSIIKRAKEKGLVETNIYNLRKWGIGRHKQVDDKPYGGGVGMVLRVDVVAKAIKEVKKGLISGSPDTLTILLTPQGKVFNQKKAWALSRLKNLILVCGHYEGFDERIKNFVDEEISIGDYVLTGGELPTMVLVDTIVRLIPGVLEKPEAIKEESFQIPLFDYPQYTRPASFHSLKVPKILLSGDHEEIRRWRKKEALKKTKAKRPDLLKDKQE
ncbi:tRNA (guanine-N(1)-)-methyltransferase [subsurface metagenome]